MARDFAGRLVVAKVNTDQHSERAARFGIRGIPTLIFFDGGREVDRVVGAAGKPELVKRAQQVLSSRRA